MRKTTPRRDGEATRRRLLDAACEVFAEKGYHGARLADICRRAGANAAAANYHFGDKAGLYVEAWRHAFRKDMEEGFPIPENLAPEERFSQLIRYLLRAFVEKSRRGRFTRLYFQELANPTGLIRDVLYQLMEPRRMFFLGLLSEITGLRIEDERLLFCELSVINQCRAVFTVRREDLEYLLGQPFSEELVERLADHIVRFSLAGLRAAASFPAPRSILSSQTPKPEPNP